VDKGKDKVVRVPLDGGLKEYLMENVEDGKIRKKVYEHHYSVGKNILPVLEEIIDNRHQISQLIG
jgi:hypothetical protein